MPAATEIEEKGNGKRNVTIGVFLWGSVGQSCAGHVHGPLTCSNIALYNDGDEMLIFSLLLSSKHPVLLRCLNLLF